MVINKRTKIDVSSYREKFQAIRSKIAKSIDITASNKEVLLMVFDQFLEGIDRDKFSAYTNTPILLISPDYKGVLIRVRYRLAELVKYAKNVQDTKGLIDLFEKFGRECGLHVIRKGRKELEVMEFYFNECWWQTETALWSPLFLFIFQNSIYNKIWIWYNFFV